MELLVGCGNNWSKQVTFEDVPKEWCELVTLDIDESVKPHVVHDLNQVPYPFDDNQFDEIHAYETLEHCGKQGDWRFFFSQFYEFWRMLKPNGYFVATCPMWDSPWAWGDPGHTRIFSRQSLIFLDQTEYEQVGKTHMTDYRPYYKGNLRLHGLMERDHNFGFILQAIK